MLVLVLAVVTQGRAELVVLVYHLRLLERLLPVEVVEVAQAILQELEQGAQVVAELVALLLMVLRERQTQEAEAVVGQMMRVDLPVVLAALALLLLLTQAHNVERAEQSHRLVATLFIPLQLPVHTRHNHGD